MMLHSVYWSNTVYVCLCLCSPGSRTSPTPCWPTQRQPTRWWKTRTAAVVWAAPGTSCSFWGWSWQRPHAHRRHTARSRPPPLPAPWQELVKNSSSGTFTPTLPNRSSTVPPATSSLFSTPNTWVLGIEQYKIILKTFIITLWICKSVKQYIIVKFAS